MAIKQPTPAPSAAFHGAAIQETYFDNNGTVPYPGRVPAPNGNGGPQGSHRAPQASQVRAEFEARVAVANGAIWHSGLHASHPQGNGALMAPGVTAQPPCVWRPANAFPAGQLAPAESESRGAGQRQEMPPPPDISQQDCMAPACAPCAAVPWLSAPASQPCRYRCPQTPNDIDATPSPYLGYEECGMWDHIIVTTEKAMRAQNRPRTSVRPGTAHGNVTDDDRGQLWQRIFADGWHTGTPIPEPEISRWPRDTPDSLAAPRFHVGWLRESQQRLDIVLRPERRGGVDDRWDLEIQYVADDVSGGPYRIVARGFDDITRIARLADGIASREDALTKAADARDKITAAMAYAGNWSIAVAAARRRLVALLNGVRGDGEEVLRQGLRTWVETAPLMSEKLRTYKFYELPPRQALIDLDISAPWDWVPSLPILHRPIRGKSAKPWPRPTATVWEIPGEEYHQ